VGGLDLASLLYGSAQRVAEYRGQDGGERQDDEGKSDGRVAAAAANSALETLMRYFEQNELSTVMT